MADTGGCSLGWKEEGVSRAKGGGSLRSLCLMSQKREIVWWMGVDYELFFATICTGSDLLVIHSLGYILMI